MTSFVRPDVIPQLADAEPGARGGPAPRRGWRVSVLIPNERGLERALAHREALSRGERVPVLLGVAQRHKNVGRSIAESLDGLRRMFTRARAEGLRCEGVISTSFGCPYEGSVPAQRVLGIARELADAGCEEIGFGDTTGMANPLQVREFFYVADRLASRRRADRPFPQHAWAGPRQRARGARKRRPPASSRPSASSADVRSRPERRGISRPRTSSRCSRRWGSRPASIWWS